MLIVKKYIPILVLSSLGVLSCYKTNKPIETDTGTETDTGADADADADIDIDADADADADTGMDVAPDCAYGKFDENTGLCWQHPKVSALYTWKEAIDYCDKLSLDGYDDWRLPSREDLIEMLGGCDSDVLGGSDGFCNSCVGSATCTALFGSDSDWHWSSSPGDDGLAWIAFFANGWVYSDSVDDIFYVRCVRSGP